jgi:hypothetical protein
MENREKSRIFKVQEKMEKVREFHNWLGNSHCFHSKSKFSKIFAILALIFVKKNTCLLHLQNNIMNNSNNISFLFKWHDLGHQAHTYIQTQYFANKQQHIVFYK